MGITSRFMTASRAFISAWRNEDTPPSTKLGWDHYAARVARYEKFRRYRDNRAYDDLSALLSVNRRKLDLYAYTRGEVNPVSRIGDLYATLVEGGPIDFDSLKTGAMPVIGADDQLTQSIIQVLLWSNWAIEKSTYARDGAILGDTVIKVVDYPNRSKIAGEIIPPELIKDDVRDASGNVKSYIIEYDMEEETSKGSGVFKSFTYTETCDKEWFRTFKDGSPFAFFQDANGNDVSEWPNIYGFVPLVIVPHKRVSGLKWGINAYYSSLPKIDDMNDLASNLTDYLRRAMNPPWLANFERPKPKPGETKSEVDVSTTRRDQERIIYASSDSAKMQSLVHPVDVAAVQAYVEYLDANITKDCPETALPQLRASGNLTAPGVQAAFKDGEGRIMEAQANYDNGVVRWIQMAITMAAIRGYKGFSAYDINSFDRGDLTFYIKPRPVIEDKLSKLDEINAWQTSGIDEKVWSLLGATEKEIEQFRLKKQQKTMIELMSRSQQVPGIQSADVPLLSDGQQQPATQPNGNAPAIRGSKLPTDQARKVAPITPEELDAIAAMHRKATGR